VQISEFLYRRDYLCNAGLSNTVLYNLGSRCLVGFVIHRCVGPSLPFEGRTAFRRHVQVSVTIVTVVTVPISKRFFCDGTLLGSIIYRHAHRHSEKRLDMRFSEWCDARDACDGGLRMFSRGGCASTS
jgi:hypothetical protein